MPTILNILYFIWEVTSCSVDFFLFILIFIVGILVYYFWPSKKIKKSVIVSVTPSQSLSVPVPSEKFVSSEKKILKRPAEKIIPRIIEDDLITFEVIGEHIVVQNDILVGKKSGKIPDTGRFLMKKPMLWPDGIVPYVIDGSLKEKTQIKEVFEYFEKETPIKFVKRIEENDYVFMTIGKENCYSYLGRIGGRQEIFLSEKCGRGEIIHELLHTLGFSHEHSRPDRDECVQIHWNVIDKKHWRQFEKMPKKIFLGHSSNFDFESIMMYSSQAFALDTKYLTISRLGNEPHYEPTKDKLSEGDREKILMVY